MSFDDTKPYGTRCENPETIIRMNLLGVHCTQCVNVNYRKLKRHQNDLDKMQKF